jgi:predicted RNA binding protein YcfA (HicA-like mRNA interferase family)
MIFEMKISEAIRKLNKAGCYFLEHGTNHDWWYSPITEKRFQVPRHQTQELTPKTKKSIEFYSGVKL